MAMKLHAVLPRPGFSVKCAIAAPYCRAELAVGVQQPASLRSRGMSLDLDTAAQPGKVQNSFGDTRRHEDLQIVYLVVNIIDYPLLSLKALQF